MPYALYSYYDIRLTMRGNDYIISISGVLTRKGCMKYSFMLVLSASLLLMFSAAGCAGFRTDITALAGTNIHDLEKAKAYGIKKTVNLGFDTAFMKIKDISNGNGLTVYQSDSKSGYLVVMGLNRQNDTTRVGIFLDPVDAEHTEITLSSLSTTALNKAGSIILDNN